MDNAFEVVGAHAESLRSKRAECQQREFWSSSFFILTSALPLAAVLLEDGEDVLEKVELLTATSAGRLLHSPTVNRCYT
jgi:hypothetical protein